MDKERVRVELRQAQARANQLQERLDEVERREHEKVVVQEQAIAAEERGPSWEVNQDELEETERRFSALEGGLLLKWRNSKWLRNVCTAS